MNEACRFPRCTALVREGYDHCSIHDPRQIMKRVRTIVLNNFSPLLKIYLHQESAEYIVLEKLQADIIHDLENTV